MRLTLRLRVALWTSVLLIACVLALALSINVATTYTTPAVPTPAPNQFVSSTFRVGGARTPVVTVRPAPGDLRTLWQRMRLITVVSLALILALGTVGTYWLAGRALRPVRAMSGAARRISTATLRDRLPVSDPRDELTELGTSFNAVLDRLEDGFLRERRFTSDASHELRTPLSTMRATIEAVQLDPAAGLQDYQEVARRLERSVARLENLAADLLTLAESENVSERDTARLPDILEEIIADRRELSDSHGVQVHLESSEVLTVRGSPLSLALAFANLVENGIRYNRPGGSVQVTYGSCGAAVIVKVRDDGHGMTEQDQVHAFERFWRADGSRSRNSGGSGLGLAIVREVASRYGGSATLESRPGEGTEVTLTLQHVADTPDLAT